MIDLVAIESKIGYTFKNKDLLIVAFTHKSYHAKNHNVNNERLEFLGDSILGFIVAEFLFSSKKRISEGGTSVGSVEAQLEFVKAELKKI
jgi:ribonuclease-3